MTTQDQNAEELVDRLIEEPVEEERGKENPLFLISVDRLAKLELSLIHI